jgi:hypothetical protein
VDGVDDFGVVDAAQVSGGDPEVSVLDTRVIWQRAAGGNPHRRGRRPASEPRERVSHAASRMDQRPARNVHEVLAQRTARSALRSLLGPIRMELVNRPPPLPRPHDPRRPRLNRNAPRGCGGRFLRWTRTQRIRTAAAIPVEVVIADAGSTPAFLRIAAKAAHLRELGMSDRAIAQALDVSDKTVAKAIDATRRDFG